MCQTTMEKSLKEMLIPPPQGQSVSVSKKATSSTATLKTHQSAPLLDVVAINRMFKIASALAVITWALLVALVYGLTPREEWAYLSNSERQAATIAFCVLLVSMILVLTPFVIQRKLRNISPIVVAAIVTQTIALLTNALLAFFPTVVKMDSYTHAQVFLIRWCEWIPLSGLMTFFSEAVEIPKTKNGTRIAVIASLCQSLSCLCGLILPYCTGLVSWNIVMFVSFITYFAIFPRVASKKERFLSTPKGKSFIEQERYDRIRFSYELIYICMVVWTLLVVIYFINMLIHRLCPVGHILRHEALAMGCDTLFDVTAKALYMKVIVDVHFVVFDADGRAQRQLGELRNLMSILWESSSDVIILSVRQDDRVTSMISPSFPGVVGSSLPSSVKGRKATALFIESSRPEQGGAQIISSLYIDSSDIPYGGMIRNAEVCTVDPTSAFAKKALDVVTASWLRTEKIEGSSSDLMVHPIEAMNGETRQCELKISREDDSAIVAVMRDVTERYRRFDAERRAHAEIIARQKDAQSQTRFVRHEVKNGLLAGVELCDSLRGALHDISKEFLMLTPETSPGVETAIRRVKNLDVTLHEILDTVLAEAMARDVVHEIYHPRFERLDVVGLLNSSSPSKRFSVHTGTPDFPYLSLDPQLLRYIHRNAVSNAIKYGRQTGRVWTEIAFCPKNNMFEMNVHNEPGEDHDRLVALGDSLANAMVFAQETRLHSEKGSAGDRYISAGDGAWIMQKCARTLGGSCSIKFRETETTFSFRCPAEPLPHVNLSLTHDFEVPPTTFGIAVDDSKIQRKLMDRILAHVGVHDSRRVVLGENPSEIAKLQSVIMDMLAEDSTSKILVLVDENLDFGLSGGESVVLSGSLAMREVLDSLTPSQERRVFALVRSANDSAEDVSKYQKRTHGFFPKAPMQRERVQEILAPLWAERFIAEACEKSCSSFFVE